MRGHMVRALLAAVSATGAIVLTVGLAGTNAAGAAAQRTHAASHPIVYTKSQAGYTVSGRWFRFVATTVKVPPAGSPVSGPGFNYAEVVLGGSGIRPVSLGIQPGGGLASIGWSVGTPPFSMNGGGVLGDVNPSAGDKVLIDLYYNQAKGSVVATATDLTANRTQSISIAVGTHAMFTAAEVAGALINPASPPATDTRLWQLTGSHVTTYTGVHGSMTGNWTTSKVVDTTNGRSSGRVVFSPSFLFGNGGNFGAWLRA